MRLFLKNKAALEKLAVIIKTSRPFHWIPLPIVYFLGLKAAGIRPEAIHFLQAFSFSFPLSLIICGVNDVYDYESDLLNKRKRFWQGIVLDKAYHSLVLKASAIAAAFIMMVSLLSFNIYNISVALVSIAVAYAYSMPPIRIKERPPFDSILNSAYFLLPFMLGYSFSGSLDIPFYVLPVSLLLIAGHAYSTVVDYSSDKKAEMRTFAIAFGKRAAAAFSLVLSIIAFFIFSWPPFLYISIILAILCYLIVLIFPFEKLALLQSYFLLAILAVDFFIATQRYLIA